MGSIIMPKLNENFTAIAEVVVDSYPNTNVSVEEFFKLYEGLDANQKKGILKKSISLSELDFDFEEKNTEQASVEPEINVSPNLETLTSPLLSVEVEGTIPSYIENRARQRRRKGSELPLNNSGDGKPAAKLKLS